MASEEATLTIELLHLPDKPAGVAGAVQRWTLAIELLHLPDKPAGVAGAVALDVSHRTPSPAGQAGRGRRERAPAALATELFTCRTSRQGW